MAALADQVHAALLDLARRADLHQPIELTVDFSGSGRLFAAAQKNAVVFAATGALAFKLPGVPTVIAAGVPR